MAGCIAFMLPFARFPAPLLEREKDSLSSMLLL